MGCCRMFSGGNALFWGGSKPIWKPPQKGGVPNFLTAERLSMEFEAEGGTLPCIQVPPACCVPEFRGPLKG